MRRDHTWPKAVFFALSISLCVCVDIFQHSVPLPFLPQALSAQGHSTMEIAAVMGGYYWAGCAGGICITSVMVYRLLSGSENREPSWSDMKSHVWKLIFGLTLGAVTLLAEAMDPPWIPDLYMHLVGRLLQGFIGAFLFFYAYLLAVKMFEGQQQVFSLTCASIALNVAEVFGPVLGAAVFTTCGQAGPYILLVVLSLLNNVLLWVVVRTLPEDEEDEEQVQLVEKPASPPLPFSERLRLFKTVMTEPVLWRAVLVIMPAACVKSCFEAVLPFFGGMHSMDEMRVGFMFMLVACSYITASVLVGYKWLAMTETQRAVLVAFALGGLACVAGCALTAYRVDWHLENFGLVDITKHEPFYFFLAVYGVFLGLTHTPASYMLGSAVDRYDDVHCQDVVNGVFNTFWEVGGSLGFLLAGHASARSWKQEQFLLCVTGCMVGTGMLVFIMTSEPLRPKHSSPLGPRLSPSIDA